MKIINDKITKEEYFKLNERALCILMKNMIQDSVSEAESVLKNNKSAGVRLRKTMQDIRALSIIIREKIQLRKELKEIGEDSVDFINHIKNKHHKTLLETVVISEVPPLLGENEIYKDFIISKVDAKNRLNTLIQHKLRILMHCAIIFNLKIEKSSYKFQKKHLIKKATLIDPKIYGGEFFLYESKNADSCILRLKLTEY